jgi:hypothetical protein
VAGSTVLVAGAVTAGYFLFRPAESQTAAPIDGSLGKFQTP